MAVHIPVGRIATRLPTLLLNYRELMPWVGVWEMFDWAEGQIGKKEEGAFLTTISPKPWWSLKLRVLDVIAQDWDKSKGRVLKHHGNITLDPNVPTQGMRTVIYEDSLVVAHSRIEFGSDPNVLIVSPSEPGYNKHLLRRTRRFLDY